MSSSDARLSHLMAVLQGRRFRLTPQRLAILRLVARSDGHPSIEEIYEHLREDFPTMSIATVYKTVTLLKELGEVLELSFPEEGVKRYDGAKPYPHPHLICVRCRKILDPDLGSLTPLVETAGRRTGFRILSHRLDLYGLCPECQTQEQGGEDAPPAHGTETDGNRLPIRLSGDCAPPHAPGDGAEPTPWRRP